MISLTSQQAVGTELPLVALVRILLAPAVCTLSLAVVLLLCEEPFVQRYAALAIIAFLASTWAFGELPLSSGRSSLSFLIPDRAVLTGWLLVIGVLLFAAFVTKSSGLYSLKVMLISFAATPFALELG